MKIENNPPAFPQTNEAMNGRGLTLLDHFAGLAMQSFIREKGLSTYDCKRNTEGLRSDVVEASYEIAAEMLSARKQFID